MTSSTWTLCRGRADKFAGYQLIRGVLAARAAGVAASSCWRTRGALTMPEMWFRVLAAVRSYDLRSRMAMLTWQEVAADHASCHGATIFSKVKYGIG